MKIKNENDLCQCTHNLVMISQLYKEKIIHLNHINFITLSSQNVILVYTQAFIIEKNGISIRIQHNRESFVMIVQINYWCKSRL